MEVVNICNHKIRSGDFILQTLGVGMYFSTMFGVMLVSLPNEGRVPALFK